MSQRLLKAKPQPHVSSSPVWNPGQDKPSDQPRETHWVVYRVALISGMPLSRGDWGDLALPSPHGATPLGATATPSTNRKRRRSQCSSEVTPRVVTANSPGKVVESGGHSLLAAVHWPRTQNSTQLSSVNLVLSHCGAPHTDAVSRAAVGKRLSLALCSRAARKWGYYLEIQLSSRAFCGSFPGQGPVIINSWSKFDRNNKNE